MRSFSHVELAYDVEMRHKLEKLADMFLNTFHSEHILLKLKIKKLLRKIKSKNLTAGV